eukprot:jgi/Hompol1/3767/HPOL_003346-RA
MQSRFLKDYDCEAHWFKHPRTGADWVHVANPKSRNNTFMVGFQTAPSDSTGVPHILEHTTLCGSQQYPVRDPFFKMLNRSMATFMNAMTGKATGDDFTFYPFSTENSTDYYNLMSVYLDAVFAPRLQKLDFMQEGWRLEHENPSDTTSPIVFKGVVYNEMKGALADTNALYYTRHQQEMYPSSIYSHVSGGDPENITDLTYEQLVAFHAKNYHPSNARFFTHGSFPLDPQMEAIEKKIASFSPIPREPLSDVPRWTEPRQVRVTGPLDPLGDPQKQTRLAVSYMLNQSKDLNESLAARILNTLLTDGAASPMYKALIESGLGSEYVATAGCHMDSFYRGHMSFGVQGMPSKNVPISLIIKKAIESIQYVLEESAKNGFDRKRIDNIFHTIELSLKHRTPSFGLHMGAATISHMIHAGHPLDAMDSAKSLEKLRTAVLEPGFFESRIESQLLSNPHRLTYIMEPDAAYPDTLAANEAKRLATHVSSLSLSRKEEIAREGLELQRLQETKQDLSCLPCLPLSEVSKTANFFPTHSTRSASGNVQHWRETQTNGVSYLYLKWDVSFLSDEDKLLLPLLCSALTSLGTKTQSLAELDESIRSCTGGIGASVLNSASIDAKNPKDLLIVSASALDRNLDGMYKLVAQVIQETDWTAIENLKTCLLTAAAGAANSVPGVGHRLAMKAAASQLSRSALSSELFSGMSQVQYLDKLSNQDDIPALADKLKELATRVWSNSAHEAYVVSGSDAVAEHKRIQDAHLAGLTPTVPSQVTAAPELTTRKFDTKNFPMDLGVNFTARAFVGVPYTHPDAAVFKILASLMTSQFMHREIREKGGAYGGAATYSALDGILYFMSYRDPPRAERTLATYDAAVEWAQTIASKISSEELEQAKLEAFQHLDRPVDAAHEGLGVFQYGLDQQTVQ